MPKPKLDEADGPLGGWCSNCFQPCGAEYADSGFAYGDHGYVEDWQLESTCCGCPVLEYDPRPEPEEVETDGPGSS